MSLGVLLYRDYAAIASLLHHANSTHQWPNNLSQLFLYPQILKKTASNPHPLPLSTHALKSAFDTNRAIVFDFGTLAFQVLSVIY